MARAVDPQNGRPLGYGEQGLLLIKGPNVMLGYLHQPDLTAQAIQNGWYATGDIAAVDEDGFIRITDRISRFSKIGGEMVPHMKVEEVINHALGGIAAAVPALRDSQRSEKLVAYYVQNGVAKEDLWDRLNQSELPKLWIPKRENLHAIDALPLLGTGKVDLKKIKAMAQERSQTPAS